MDENEFFREATIRICGNLKIEEAMVSSLNFLRKEMPVDRMFLQFQDVGFNSLRIISMATPEEGRKVDWLTPLSSKALQEQKNMIDKYRQQDLGHIIN